MAARGTPVVLMDPNTDLPYAAGGSGGGGGGGPATVADGADIAQGSRADAAYTDTTGAASSTLVGIVKGAFVLLAARLPLGVKTAANSLAVTLASDSAVSTAANQTTMIASGGAPTDAVYTDTTGAANGTMIALLKGVFKGLYAATPTGTNKIGGVTIAAGDDASTGNTTDAAYAGSGNSSVIAALKGVYARLAGPLTTKALAVYKFRLANLTGTQTNGTLIRSGAGSLTRITAVNTLAAISYLNLYDKATAPVLGTDSPIYAIPIPANTALDTGLPGGLDYTNGIGFTFSSDTLATQGLATNNITLVCALSA